MLELEDLVGTWHLVRYARRDGEGNVVLPLGPSPVGRLTYSDDGYMHALMIPAGRARYASNDLFGGSEAERLGAAEHFVSYCGPFEIRGDTVYHCPEASFFPNWEGESLPREARLERGDLVLVAPKGVRDGRTSTAEIVWRRRPSN